ncbi:hypothetical protein [Falsigemmobacter faecalis]|uniref:Uncharacterized protein n=1 Tax=Falsigemmobacter faecalis TaxID=2488730 RepID=A0A3P3DPQ3_9RHOB|nr:hypothetical protein [Falsigemmobacter faecalis]RRH75522.1 hypothetical protein EG244_08545 [Falsigemmobacter faecalis]
MTALRPVTADISATRALQTVTGLGCDQTERGVLSVVRHFTIANQRPRSEAWTHAFTIATERWGDLRGLEIAGAAADLVQALLALREGAFAVHDPLDLHARLRLSDDEAALLRLLRALRQDLTPLAREELAGLGHGRIDPALITAALRLSRLLPAPRGGSVYHASHPGLRLVQ